MSQAARAAGPLRVADRVGIGWRAPLAASIFTHLDGIDVVEIIADEYFHARGRVLRSMRSLAREVPVAVHGVALGLASVVPVPGQRLDRLARLINDIQPALWSEHLAFVRGGSHEIGHLAAPPRNAMTVEGTLHNISRARAVVGSPAVLENIATLIEPPDSSLSEPEWVTAILAGSASPLLLDLHNLYANAVNFGHDPLEFLRRFPLDRVQVVHLSGGHWIELEPNEFGLESRRLLDDHVHDVPEAVYSLLTELGSRCRQPLTVILERDGNYPEFPELFRQLARARDALAEGRRRGEVSHELAAL
jgi:uncharacterized protein (UPF0276 family)